MVLKERMNRPKLCFRAIRPRIIFHHVKDHFYFGPPSLFLFIFTLTHLFLWVSFHFTFFFLFFRVLLHFVFLWTLAFFVSPNFFLGLKLFAACLLTTGVFMIFRDPWNFTFRHLSSSVEGAPWSGFRKKIIRLKRGDYGYFSISVMG